MGVVDKECERGERWRGQRAVDVECMRCQGAIPGVIKTTPRVSSGLE